MDSNGNVIIVGSTLSPGLGTSGVFQQEFQSRANIRYYDPETGSYSDVATTPKIGLLDIQPSVSRSEIFTFGGFFAYRWSQGIWKEIVLDHPSSDGIFKGQIADLGSTAYLPGADYFAAVPRRVLYLSRDAGVQWRLAGTEPSLLPDSVYPSSHDPCRLVDFTATLQSLDCGSTWKQVVGPGQGQILSLFDPRGNGRWIATGTDPGKVPLSESTDAGSSWRTLTRSMPSPSSNAAFTPDPMNLLEFYVSGAEGISRSRDGVTNWDLVYPLSRLGSAVCSALFSDPKFSQVYALCWSSSKADNGLSLPQLFTTSDGFKTMNKILGDQLANDYTGAGYIALKNGPNGGVYTITRPRTDGFVAKYDRTGRQLFFTYLGGEHSDEINSVATDASGNIYVTGITRSKSFPTTNPSPAANASAFISKLSADGRKLLWSNVFPTDGSPTSILADQSGSVFVTGSASPTLIPNVNGYILQLNSTDGKIVFSGAIERAVQIPRSFKTHFPHSLAMGPDGNLYIGLDDFIVRYKPTERTSESFISTPYGRAMKIGFNPDGTLWAVGNSLSLQRLGTINQSLTTPGAFQRIEAGGDRSNLPNQINDAWVGKFSKNGDLLAGTYFGGPGSDAIVDGFVDPGGNVVAVGTTTGRQLPLSSPLEMMLRPFSGNSFALKFDSPLSTLQFGTFLNDFDAAAILPHAEGGYWLIGSGRRDTEPGHTFTDAQLIHLRSSPAALPRIDSVLNTTPKDYLRPGSTATIQGEGFELDAQVWFGDMKFAAGKIQPKSLEVPLPESVKQGIYDVSVETRGRRSAPVRVRVY